MFKTLKQFLAVGAAVGLAACADAPTMPDVASSPVTASRQPKVDVASAPVAASRQPKVDVCHVDGGGRYRVINIAAPAVPGHLGHGDGLPGEAFADHSGFLTDDCALGRIVLDPTTTYDTPQHGGGGGGAFADDCAAGHAATGISGVRASWFGWAAIWDYRLECRELRGDGTLGASSTTPGRGNGAFTALNSPFTGICASDALLVAGSGVHSDVMSSVGGGCGSVAHLLAMTGGEESSIGPFSGTGVTFNIAFNEQCDPGFAITGVTGRSGNVLDRVGFRCTQVAEEIVD